MLITADTSYHSAVTNAEKIAGLAVSITSKRINYFSGLEYYVLPAFPIRLGVFTNHDARPEVKEGEINQADHIDYIGGTAYFAWVQPNSQIGAGVVLQNGRGKAQKIGSSTDIQR